MPSRAVRSAERKAPVDVAYDNAVAWLGRQVSPEDAQYNETYLPMLDKMKGYVGDDVDAFNALFEVFQYHIDVKNYILDNFTEEDPTRTMLMYNLRVAWEHWGQDLSRGGELYADFGEELDRLVANPRTDVDMMWRPRAPAAYHRHDFTGMSKQEIAAFVRSYNGAAPLDLRGVDLSYTDLTGVNLMGANLEGANLSNTRLSGANFSFTNLRNAHLQYGQVYDMRGISFVGANMEGADLTNMIITGIGDFSGANLTGATMRRAHLEFALLNANFTGADLAQARVLSADLRGANLRGANLTEAMMSGANLQKSNLRGAEMTGAVLEHANLQGADMQEANIVAVNFRDAIIIGADLTGAHLDGSVFTGALFGIPANATIEQGHLMIPDGTGRRRIVRLDVEAARQADKTRFPSRYYDLLTYEQQNSVYATF
ncbi:hypothetical protein DRN67_00690 [Candidatus Micrarchaeota archaeon]|nr:MAG: hypothetical protein DRN67_00690 [Candidatus Micrarchaeota archaeon]